MDIALVKPTVEFALKVLYKKFFSKNEIKDDPFGEANASLGSHLNFISNWSSRIQFYGLNTAKDIDSESIELSLSSTPRRFFSKSKNNEIKHETAFYIDRRNYLLLGDPGAGKTTTLKRIARKALLGEPHNHNDIFSFPILIRLKEIKSCDNIFAIIANIFGIKMKIIETEENIEKVIKYKDLNGETKNKTYIETVKIKNYYVNNISIDTIIPTFLDESNVLILIDGLDELNASLTEGFEKSVEKLSLSLTVSKIILTCRSGYYNRTLEGLDLFEILPLDPEQILEIASIWLDNPNEFLNECKKVPYKDLTDRPLFLTQLLFIFDRQGELPRQPSQIYKLIVELLLRQWDSERRIIRSSKYSNFGVREKAEFLAELSYNLTCEIKIKRFNSSDLIAIYNNICNNFDLPKNEANEVATEIETHTGLVVKAGFDHYEFSHLSLQEYLCADYIVRAPLNNKLFSIIAEYPEPTAIAVALSSNPSGWLSNFILSKSVFQKLKHKMNLFLIRLMDESPTFRTDQEFGFAMLSIFLQHFSDIDYNAIMEKTYKKFFKIDSVKKSINLYLHSENISFSRFGDKEKFIRISMKPPNKSFYSLSSIKTFDFGLYRIDNIINNILEVNLLYK